MHEDREHLSIMQIGPRRIALFLQRATERSNALVTVRVYAPLDESRQPIEVRLYRQELHGLINRLQAALARLEGGDGGAAR
jgi:hypothetical protein